MAIPVVYTETLKVFPRPRGKPQCEHCEVDCEPYSKARMCLFSFVVVVVSLFSFGRPGTHYID